MKVVGVVRFLHVTNEQSVFRSGAKPYPEEMGHHGMTGNPDNTACH